MLGNKENYGKQKIQWYDNMTLPHEYKFKSSTDTEVISNMIQYLKKKHHNESMEKILHILTGLMEGTWACIISDIDNPDKLFFMKNESPLLIGKSETDTNPLIMYTSEPSGFMNMVSKYFLLTGFSNFPLINKS